MRTFEKTITVVKEDLDDLDHVNNVRFVQWIQDISKEHWQKLASPEIQKKVVWVVMNHNITYSNSAKLNDPIRIRTQVAKSKGATSVRTVEMYNDKTNRLLLRSNTQWCLLDAKTHKPIRISDEIKDLFYNSDG